MVERTPEPRPVSGVLNFVKVLLNLALFSCSSFLIRFLFILSDFFHRLFFLPWIDPMRCQATFGSLRFAKPATSPVPTSCARQTASGEQSSATGRVHSNRSEAGGREPRPEQRRQVRKSEAVCHTSVSRPQGPASARQGGYWRGGLSVSRPRPGRPAPRGVLAVPRASRAGCSRRGHSGCPSAGAGA